RQIVENFWASTERVPRPGDGVDGVEGYFIGASHYGKTTREYLEEARACENAVKSLYAGTINPGGVFRTALATGSGRTLRVRPARANGLSAGDSKAVYWTGARTFLLEPHEDFAQVKSPDQKDFEIQQAIRVIAVNVYPEVPMNSGQIQLWNVAPDDSTRVDLDLTYSGFPYPAELLAEYPSTIIPVATVDLCVLNANLVHAVLRGDTTSEKTRLLVTFFMTLKNNHELIWWT